MFGFSSFAELPFATGSVVTYATTTGVEATGQLGTVSIVGKAVVSPTGVQATGFIGNVLIWSLIPDGQNPNWAAINDGQTPNWTAVNDGQTVTWVEVIT